MLFTGCCISAIIFSDFIFLQTYSCLINSQIVISKVSAFVINFCSNDNKIWEESAESILNTDEHLEEREKLSYLCSCATDSLQAGGSVLISINRVGVVLQLLEQISPSLESLTPKVAIYSFCFG